MLCSTGQDFPDTKHPTALHSATAVKGTPYSIAESRVPVNPAVDCHYFPPGTQLPTQPLIGLQPISRLGEERHDGCEQFAQDCYPTASRLRFEPRPFCAWVQHANHSATEPTSIEVDSENSVSQNNPALLIAVISDRPWFLFPQENSYLVNRPEPKERLAGFFSSA